MSNESKTVELTGSAKDEYIKSHFGTPETESEPVDYDYEQPEWIVDDLTPHDLAAINQGGCASGAYMPAVTYYQANKTMADHGDDVLDYIVEQMGELPKPHDTESWSGMAVHFLSYAVELFCNSHSDLEDWENDEPINQ